MTKDLILLGGGGHCKSCIDVIEQQGIYKIIGILDKEENIGLKISNYEIIGTDLDILGLLKTIKFFFISIGQIKTATPRVELYDLLIKNNAELPILISPYAYVSNRANIGKGTIVMHHALVNAEANVGNNCIINSKALIEHDVRIENNCHIATGVILNGGVKVGEGSFIGSGTITKQNISIPPNSFIKANSFITK